MNKSIKDKKPSQTYCRNCSNLVSKVNNFNKPIVVIVFGVFDLLHPGHIAFLQAARTHGDQLIVVVTQDERVELEKGNRPIFTLKERMFLLRALSCVTQVISGDAVGEWTMIQQLKPDIICVGYDQIIDNPKFTAQLDQLKNKPQIIQLPGFEPKTYSTSKIKQKIIDKINKKVNL